MLNTTTNNLTIKTAHLDTDTRFTVPMTAYHDLPASNQKSYYGKAKVIFKDNYLALASYMSPVIIIDQFNHITVDPDHHDTSKTTHKHELDFIKYAQDHGYLDTNLKYQEIMKAINQAAN